MSYTLRYSCDKNQEQVLSSWCQSKHMKLTSSCDAPTVKFRKNQSPNRLSFEEPIAVGILHRLRVVFVHLLALRNIHATFKLYCIVSFICVRPEGRWRATQTGPAGTALHPDAESYSRVSCPHHRSPSVCDKPGSPTFVWQRTVYWNCTVADALYREQCENHTQNEAFGFGCVQSEADTIWQSSRVEIQAHLSK